MIKKIFISLICSLLIACAHTFPPDAAHENNHYANLLETPVLIVTDIFNTSEGQMATLKDHTGKEYSSHMNAELLAEKYIPLAVGDKVILNGRLINFQNDHYSIKTYHIEKVN